MSYLVLLFASLTIMAGLIIVISPGIIYGLFQKYANTMALQAVAVIVRLVLGVALIAVAAHSKFPQTLQVLGWLTLVAAIVFACMGSSKFVALLNWAVSRPAVYQRLGGIFAILLGGFLFYAVF